MLTVHDLTDATSNKKQSAAELLLAHVLGRDRAWLLAHPNARVLPATAARFRRLCNRLTADEPFSYLTGERWFYGRALRVTHDALIPRPETELLIDLTLRHLRSETLDSKFQILDIGTGSGCIAVTIAAELPTARITAIDASSAALRIARANARRHGVTERIRFMRGDLLSQIFHVDDHARGGMPLPRPSVETRSTGDAEGGSPTARRSPSSTVGVESDRTRGPRPSTGMVILANLPYLTTREWRSLPRSIRAFEPRQALDGGPDGLKHFRKLFAELDQLNACAPPPPPTPRKTSCSYRNNSSHAPCTCTGIPTTACLLEIDPRRKHELSALVRRMLPKWSTAWHRDLAGHWRVLELHPQRWERAIG